MDFRYSSNDATPSNKPKRMSLAERFNKSKERNLKKTKLNWFHLRENARVIKKHTDSIVSEFFEEENIIPSTQSDDFREIVARKSFAMVRRAIPEFIDEHIGDVIEQRRLAKWKLYQKKNKKLIDDEFRRIRGSWFRIPEDFIVRDEVEKPFKNPMYMTCYSIPEIISGRVAHPAEYLKPISENRIEKSGLSMLKYAGYNNSAPFWVRTWRKFEERDLLNFFNVYSHCLEICAKDPWKAFVEANLREDYPVFRMRNSWVDARKLTNEFHGNPHHNFFIEWQGIIWYAEPEYATIALWKYRLEPDYFKAAIAFRALMGKRADDIDIWHWIFSEIRAMMIEKKEKSGEEIPTELEETITVEELEKFKKTLRDMGMSEKGFYTEPVEETEEDEEEDPFIAEQREILKQQQEFTPVTYDSDGEEIIDTRLKFAFGWNEDSETGDDAEVSDQEDPEEEQRVLKEIQSQLTAEYDVFSKKPEKERDLLWENDFAWSKAISMVKESSINPDRFTVVARWPRTITAYDPG